MDAADVEREFDGWKLDVIFLKTFPELFFRQGHGGETLTDKFVQVNRRIGGLGGRRSCQKKDSIFAFRGPMGELTNRRPRISRPISSSEHCQMTKNRVDSARTQTLSD